MFRSDTDTEVLAHLINDMKSMNPDLPLAGIVAKSLLLVKGTIGMVVLDQAKPDMLVRSPEHVNVIFGIKYCRNSPEIAIVVIIICAHLCSCGLKRH